MAITIKTNIVQVGQDLKNKISKIKDKEYLLRPVCFDLIDLMTRRIHVDGVASDGNPIGTYSNGYLRIRLKEKRGTDRKVIVSLTRQLENDWSVIATAKGYGIGFKNSHNLDKARWVEEIKEKKIFDLSASEKTYAIDLIKDLSNNALK